MTTKAIDLLDEAQRKGFFLQVEGASIDKQDHAANACGQIGETVDLDEAVKAALDFAAKDGNTSVFVTADHAHTSQIVEAGSVTPGLTVTLLTADGAPMTINYGTAAGQLAAAHRRPVADRRLRARGGEHRRADRPDRPEHHHPPHPGTRQEARLTPELTKPAHQWRGG